jgi:hypothetical protein
VHNNVEKYLEQRYVYLNSLDIFVL